MHCGIEYQIAQVGKMLPNQAMLPDHADWAFGTD